LPARFAIFLGASLILLPCASAQISPGPLARAHQSLDGPTQCSNCHTFGRGAAVLKCVECHTEIGERVAAHRGLHATYSIPPGSNQQCARCHSEHNGRDFPIVKFDRAAFDHKQAGFVLEGKHQGLSCERCHNAQNIAPAQKQLIKVRDLNRTFLGLSQACSSCHQDAHNGRLGANCAQCHNSTDWKTTAGQFDHSKTRFPLTGLHAQVACERCHTPGPDNKPRYIGLAFGKCADCHADPHRESFGQQGCETCHSTAGWKRVASSALQRSFDHSKTAYPLLGKHQQVDCVLCHASGNFKHPLAYGKCTDCHADAHHGQFLKRADRGECSSCHRVEGFKPAKFTVKDHALTGYPLEGKHASVECAQCHIPRGEQTAFKIKFDRCTNCHADAHQGQFAAAPYLNQCERCHTLNGYRPATFGLAQHQKSRFVLTGAHMAVTCEECHRAPATASTQTKSVAPYRFPDLGCTTCHQDPHKGQFRDWPVRASTGRRDGCEACHSTKTWKDLSQFDHEQTAFPLVGVHRAVGCIDCHRPANLGTKLANADFRAAPTACEQCHADIHGAQFAKLGVTRCAECHDSARWKPSLFDHDKRTGFRLEGAHRNVACADCHKLKRVVAGKPVLFYAPTPKLCTDCHASAVPGTQKW